MRHNLMSLCLKMNVHNLKRLVSLSGMTQKCYMTLFIHSLISIYSYQWGEDRCQVKGCYCHSTKEHGPCLCTNLPNKGIRNYAHTNYYYFKINHCVGIRLIT